MGMPVRKVRLCQLITRPVDQERALWVSIGALGVSIGLLSFTVAKGAPRETSNVEECHRNHDALPVKKEQTTADPATRRALRWKSVLLVFLLLVIAATSFCFGPKVGTVIGGFGVAVSALINIQRRMWEEKGYEPNSKSEEKMRVSAGVGAAFLLGAASAALVGCSGIGLPVIQWLLEQL